MLHDKIEQVKGVDLNGLLLQLNTEPISQNSNYRLIADRSVYSQLIISMIVNTRLVGV